MEIMHNDTFTENAEYFEIAAPENSVICLSVNHEIYAVEIGTGFLLSIPLEALTCNDTLLVTVTKQDHLRYSEGVICENISSLDNLTDQQSQITIYPNPASDRLFIYDDRGFDKIKKLTLLNIKGESIASKKSKSRTNKSMVFDLEGLSNGIYFIEVKTANSIITRKFIISK